MPLAHADTPRTVLSLRPKKKIIHINNNTKKKIIHINNNIVSDRGSEKPKHVDGSKINKPSYAGKPSYPKKPRLKIPSTNKYKLAFRKIEGMFPKVFNLSHPKPLSIGIREELFERNISMSKKTVRKALFFYCSSHQYLKKIKEGAKRYDLNAKTSSIVTTEEAVKARKNLEDLYAVIKAKKKNS